jgi:phenylacetic acid degradation operon negative regulatory protein
VARSPGAAAVADLESASCSNGAPSARNLLVTVFGDALLPYGATTTITVRALAALVAPFGCNERLVRTSLTRLVKEDLLATVSRSRRSFYGVAETSLELFANADHRIYAGDAAGWDGLWTLVVIDGSEATSHRRARLRQELAWAGFGNVGPNVMASPVAGADLAAHIVEHVGGFRNVLVSRSSVVESAATMGADQLAHRVVELDDVAAGYERFVRRFERFDRDTLGSLDPQMAFKLRTLLVATFRRVALADPQLPAALLPEGWIGDRARALAGDVYRAVADSAEQFLVSVAEPPLTPAASRRDRFTLPARISTLDG